MYNYSLIANKPLSNNYQNYHAMITGTNYNNTNYTTAFRIPTKYVSIFASLNNTSASSTLISPYTYIKNIVFEEVDE